MNMCTCKKIVQPNVTKLNLCHPLKSERLAMVTKPNNVALNFIGSVERFHETPS